MQPWSRDLHYLKKSWLFLLLKLSCGVKPRGRRTVHGVRPAAAVQHPDVVDERREAVHGRRRRRHRRVAAVASDARVDDEEAAARLQLR